MNKISLFVIALLALFFTKTNAQMATFVPKEKINPALLNNHWNAMWIKPANGQVLDYGVFHFRKNFNISKLPNEFIVHLSADNRYRFFVNGQPICFGPARGDLAHWFYESVDIAPFLKEGKNQLAAIVWNFGEQKPWAQFSIKTAFILQGNSEVEEVVNTNQSWKVMRNEAYQRPDVHSLGQFIVVGPGDKVDASLFPWGWELPTFDDTQWPSAITEDVGHPRGVGTDINWVLTPRRIPAMETKWQKFASVRRSNAPNLQPEGFLSGTESWTITANQNTTILLDQGTLTTGYPEFTISGGKGTTIRFTYAESLFDKKGQKGNRNEITEKEIKGYSDIFIPDGSHQRVFRPLWFRTWRYLQIDIETGDEPLIIENPVSQFAAYPLKANGVFESDNKELQQIWEVGWRTARLCANETYYDCPYYEQLQYVGDTRIQSLISLYVSGDDRLVRNALLQYDESRFYEGLTQSRYPSASPQVIPPFSLYWIDMVHDYWTLRDDPEFVKGFLGGIDNVMEWFIRRVDPVTGMVGKVEYWNFVDWTLEWPWIAANRIGGVPKGARNDGQSSILTMQLAYAASRAAELHQELGDLHKATTYQTLAKSLTNATYQHCWDKQKNYLADTPEKSDFSMHAQIFGVLTNTIPEKDQQPFILRFINDKSLYQPTMYFRFYLTQALKKCGLANHYLETLDLWKEMINKGLTTFAENPDPARSDCHAWSSSPNYDFLATVAGIRPASAGFRTVVIEPALGELHFIRGKMPHPEGEILFDLKREGEKGLSGTIVLPGKLTGTFHWNGVSVSIKPGMNPVSVK